MSHVLQTFEESILSKGYWILFIIHESVAIHMLIVSKHT